MDFIIKKGVLNKYKSKNSDAVIPDSVTSIGDGAFRYCSGLASVIIPEGVTSIGDEAFYGCSSLTKVIIPESVTSIGNKAFYGCSSLTKVIIPESVTSIGNEVFYETPWWDSQEGVIKAGQVVIAYKGWEEEIVIPTGATSIGDRAFYGCSSLTKVIIPDSVTDIGKEAFSGCSRLISIAIPDWVRSIGDSAFSDCRKLTSITIPKCTTRIENWMFFNCSSLSCITIPKSVTSIGRGAFYACDGLLSMEIPDSVENIGNMAFYGCSSLKRITIPDSVRSIGEKVFFNCILLENIVFLGDKSNLGKLPFGEEECVGRGSQYGFPKGLKEKYYDLIPHLTDGTLKEYILETELWGKMTSVQQAKVFLSRQSKTLTQGYLKCINDNQLETLGKELEECLHKKPSVKECSAVALYMTGFKNKVPIEKLQTLYALLKPIKAASKALRTIEDDLVLMEKLGQKLTVDETVPPAERLVMERLIANKKTLKDLETLLKDYYRITYADLPPILDKNGKEIKPYVLSWLLLTHEKLYYGEPKIIETCSGVCQEAKEVLDELDEEIFQSALLELSKKFLRKYVNTNEKYLCYPICRYAGEALMDELTKEAAKWETTTSGKNAPPLLQFRTGCLYNDTRTAMRFAERYHDLDAYAKLRGTDADTLRDTVLSEFGLDETGKKKYDLGNTILEAALQDDLTISLYDQGAQKTVKSVPKKNADPEKYEAAKRDLADIRKNLKKVAKARNNALFENFLKGKEYGSENWKEINYTNPLLNMISRLLVWQQGIATFTLSSEGAIESTGKRYMINSTPIRLAHPMEMSKNEVEAWQKYFTSHGLKQPFSQMWEPVIDPKLISEDRYFGTVLPLIYFNGRDKHGIIGRGFKSYSGSFDVEFKDCNLELDSSVGRLLPADNWVKDYTYTLGKFSFTDYTRYTNHIVGILDGWTVEQRILKDDVSVIDNLDSFTLAQITEFINKASEHSCNNVTAVLLEYKNEHFADYDPMERFWLEDF